ncbi:aminoglycoside phosphotransferase family protein [Bacillaceae bacterium CLA-AA-H227]|uniref:Aminoglycoside phosphotransferase family protein n=1 Tax=Robertmurraya yapensis (ex Hitch et al 2024) TaxID=3133160 RepID=A0ACC6SHJ8_9BACI
MEIPSTFRDKIIGAFREEGSSWLAGLEQLVATYLDKWGLTSLGPVSNLSYNYVLKVVDEDGNPGILKFGLAGRDFSNEVRAIEAYGGTGCARILKTDIDNGVMLLEQLIPGTMLSQLEDEEQIIEEYIKVWKAIRRPRPSDGEFPSLGHWMEGLSRYQNSKAHLDGLISEELVLKAQSYFRESSSENEELLHGDLHHENILYSDVHGWFAIDPKGVVGNPYFDLVSFLTNQLKDNPQEILELRINRLCDGLSLERLKLLKAALALSTLYAFWAVEDGDPDWLRPYQCAEWFLKWIEEDRE